MVGSSVMVVTVAKASAEMWQHVACITEHVSGTEIIELIFCIPIQQLGRLAFCLWTFFCLPPSPPDSSFYYYYYYDHDHDDQSDPDTSSDSSAYDSPSD